MDLYLPTSELRGSHQRALDKLVPVHHSLTDWDFQAGVGFHISTDQYVSSPSSLARPVDATQGSYGWCLLKEALGSCIPEGRISTYFRSQYNIALEIGLFARVQAPPEDSIPDNCYYFLTTYLSAKLFRRVAGVNTTLATYNYDPDLVINTWYCFRFTWYNWLTADLASVLRLIMEQYVDSSWVELGRYDDGAPLWDSSATNRVGFYVGGSRATRRTYTDDTIIEKRV